MWAAYPQAAIEPEGGWLLPGHRVVSIDVFLDPLDPPLTTALVFEKDGESVCGRMVATKGRSEKSRL
jgi:hypothetical protein